MQYTAACTFSIDEYIIGKFRRSSLFSYLYAKTARVLWSMLFAFEVRAQAMEKVCITWECASLGEVRYICCAVGCRVALDFLTIAEKRGGWHERWTTPKTKFCPAKKVFCIGSQCLVAQKMVHRATSVVIIRLEFWP